VVLRPVEMVTLRATDTGQFLYGGASTYWDPPAAARDAMRAVARSVARGLREIAPPGRGGPFTVDGVLTRDGFLPTELNPRIGFGLLMMERGLADGAAVPLGLFALAATEGFHLGDAGDLAALEAAVVAAADARRTGSARSLVEVDVVPEKTASYPVARGGGGRLRFAGPGEPVVGELSIGPSYGGAFVSFAPRPEHVAPGSSLGAWAVAAFALADAELGTRFGSLEPAAPAS
jgi:hypothetical protein